MLYKIILYSTFVNHFPSETGSLNRGLFERYKVLYNKENPSLRGGLSLYYNLHVTLAEEMGREVNQIEDSTQ